MIYHITDSVTNKVEGNFHKWFELPMTLQKGAVGYKHHSGFRDRS